MSRGKVSIVAPIYNAQEYLAECLDSIMGQSYENLEIILIDDGSKDSSGDIVEGYAKKDKRIVVIHQKNAGASAAKNTGIKAASGEYITFIDADDYVRADYVENMVGDVEGSSADVVTTPTEMDRADSIETEFVEALAPGEALLRLYYGRLEKSANGVQMFRASVLKDNGIFFDKKKKISEDFDFLVRALRVSRAVVVDYRRMYYYRPNPESVMHEKLSEAFFVAVINKSTAGLEVAGEYPGLQRAIEADIFASSASLAVRSYDERQKWQPELSLVASNIRRHKWGTLFLSRAKSRIRITAALYCILGYGMATRLLRSIRK